MRRPVPAARNRGAVITAAVAASVDEVGAAESSSVFRGHHACHPSRHSPFRCRTRAQKMGSHDLSYRILGVNVAVHCPAPELRALVQAHWGHMASGQAQGDLTYAISRRESTSAISIARPGQPTKWTTDEGEFLYELEGDASIAVQRLRRDLYFLHAAVAEVEGKASLFVAESGGGKSTTLWGLLHHGWSYLSDELAPIDLSSMRVHAYPRALCLKRQPPRAYPLPDATLETPRTFHVPVEHLPHVSHMESCPLVAVYFVNYCPERQQPGGSSDQRWRSRRAVVCEHLNQLAHANAGLDAAVRIAKSIPSFALDSADLAATCALGRFPRRSRTDRF